MIWLLLGGIPLGLAALFGLVMMVIDEPVFVGGMLLIAASVFAVCHGLDQLGVQ